MTWSMFSHSSALHSQSTWLILFFCCLLTLWVGCGSTSHLNISLFPAQTTPTCTPLLWKPQKQPSSKLQVVIQWTQMSKLMVQSWSNSESGSACPVLCFSYEECLEFTIAQLFHDWSSWSRAVKLLAKSSFQNCGNVIDTTRPVLWTCRRPQHEHL